MTAINRLIRRYTNDDFTQNKRLRTTWVEVGVSVLIVISPTLLTSGYQVRLLENIAMFSLLAMGLNLAFGFTGQISLGHAAFYAIGAYGSAILEIRFDLPAIIAWPAAIAFSMLIALLISLPFMRLVVHWIAMATLAFGLFVEELLSQGGEVTGGHDGLIIPVTRVLGRAVQEQFVFVVVVSAVVAYWLLRNLTESSSVGRSLRALRDDPDGAASIGIPVAAYRTLSVVVAGGLAAIAGIFYAHVAQVITPEVFGYDTSIQILVMVVLGGMGHRLGGVFGAAALLLIPEFLYGFDQYRNLVFGVLVLAVLIFLPRGIAGLPGTFRYMLSRVRGAHDHDGASTLRGTGSESGS